MDLKHITENRMLIRACAITLIVYLLFALLAKPDIKPLRRPRSIPLRISYISSAETSAGSKHALWSPSLFAFPSEQGFSGAFLAKNNFETEVTSKEPDHFNRFLNAPLGTPQPATRRLATKTEPTLRISKGDNQSVFNPAQTSGIRLQVGKGLSARLVSRPDLELIENLPAGIWQYTASLTVNRYGQVTHVFVEPSSKQNQPMPAPLITALHSLTFEPASDETQGRVSIYSITGETP